jgi:predicted nucleic acid-binding protein
VRRIGGKRDQEQVNEVLGALEDLKQIIVPVSKSPYEQLQERASQRLPQDPEDWPCVALALHLGGCPIWTKDTDYFGCGLPVWTNQTVRVYAE